MTYKKDSNNERQFEQQKKLKAKREEVYRYPFGLLTVLDLMVGGQRKRKGDK